MPEKLLIIPLLLVVMAAPEFGAGQMEGCAHCNGSNAEAGDPLKEADRLYAQFKPREAAAKLRKALQLNPNNVEVLSKLSRAYIDIGDSVSESQPDWKTQRIREYRTAESYARQAIRADPDSTWGYFYLAASLGSMASVSPVEQQVEMANEIRRAVEKAIVLDPQNGFAYHIYGVWHRRMAEIGKMSRFLASVWYGRSLPQGDLDKSVEYLEKAVSLNPKVIVSRLELARSYIAKEERPPARALLESIAKMPIQFSDDASHKKVAKELLQKLDDR